MAKSRKNRGVFEVLRSDNLEKVTANTKIWHNVRKKHIVKEH